MDPDGELQAVYMNRDAYSRTVRAAGESARRGVELVWKFFGWWGYTGKGDLITWVVMSSSPSRFDSSSAHARLGYDCDEEAERLWGFQSAGSAKGNAITAVGCGHTHLCPIFVSGTDLDCALTGFYEPHSVMLIISVTSRKPEFGCFGWKVNGGRKALGQVPLYIYLGQDWTRQVRAGAFVEELLPRGE